MNESHNTLAGQGLVESMIALAGCSELRRIIVAGEKSIEFGLARAHSGPAQERSGVKQYQRLFEMEGVALTVAGEALGAIARKAIDHKTGARGLRSIMEATLLDTMFDLRSLKGLNEVMISQQVVDGAAGPLYMYAGGWAA